LVKQGLDQTEASLLATKLDLPLISFEKTPNLQQLSVIFDEQGCSLASPDDRLKPIRVDFTSGSVDHRRKFGGGKGQLIAKAVGIKSGIYPCVLDATAGLGKDSFVLASLGCDVTMLERSPVIAALLKSGLSQASQSSEIADIVGRMHFIAEDAISWINGLEENLPDVVYLDPMFPHREKSSLVKKEMRLFRPVVGDDGDAAALLSAALSKAQYRVVVKRPRKAPAIDGPAPSYVLEGKSSRYDIYTLKSLNLLKSAG
jgi:16S rRNA (guanine1516-N2)-methyltransferase